MSTIQACNQKPSVESTTPSSSAELFGALFDPETWVDPYPFYDTLRSTPVLRLEDDLWVVSSHQAVQTVLRSSDCSIDERNASDYSAADDPDGSYHQAFDDMMLFMDPPDHTRLRRLMVRAFTPRQVATLWPRANATVARLLDDVEHLDSFDLIGSVAQPLAVEMICELLGVPFDDHERFAVWGNDFARLLDPRALRTAENDERANHAAHELREYFAALIERRRSSLGDDLLSQMIEAEAEGDRLNHNELVASAMLLLVAGFETTINLIGNGTAALVKHRDAIKRLREEPELIASAVDEMLRYDSPVQMTIRVAMAELEIQGVLVAPGAKLVNFLGAASRDPAVFDEPNRFDINRAHNPLLAFGGGIHHCLGAALARAEAQATILALVDRYPNLELAEPPLLRPTFTLRGYDRLMVG